MQMGSFVFASLASVALFSNILVSNTSASDCSLTIDMASQIELKVIPSVEGTFVTSDTTTPNISIKTSNYSGYTLGISASTSNSNALKNTSDNTITIPSITTSVSSANYADSTYAASNNLNNTWDYRPSKLNSTTNTNYLQAPTSTSVTILDQTSVANATTSNTYNIAIGSRVNLDQALGTYANTFIITAVANAVPYSITYNANAGSDTVANLPSVQSSATMDNKVSLSATTPTRANYSFAGWCNNNSSETSCSNTLYQAGSEYPIDQTNSNDVALYAIWTPNIYTITWNGNGGSTPDITMKTYGSQIGTLPISTYDNHNFLGWFTAADDGVQISETTIVATNVTYYAHWEAICAAEGTFDGEFCRANKIKQDGYYTMQDMATSICAAVTTPTTATEDISTQLIDIRDDKIYWVAKLMDGNCWMAQNLDLNLDNSIVLTNTDTDLNTKTSWTPPTTVDATLNKVTSGTQIGALSALGWVNDGSSASSIDVGDIYFDNTTVANGEYLKNLVNGVSADMFSTNTEHGHMGNYYNYYAATAESSTNEAAKTSLNAEDSICPANWRLPTCSSGTTCETDGLFNNYSLATDNPIYFSRAGFVNGDKIQAIQQGGIWTAYTTTEQDIKKSKGTHALISTKLDKGVLKEERKTELGEVKPGYSIRCLAR